MKNDCTKRQIADWRAVGTISGPRWPQAWRRGAYLVSMKTRSNAKAKAQSNAHKAFSNYLATRRACLKGHASIQQVAKALALFDLTLAIANLGTRKS